MNYRETLTNILLALCLGVFFFQVHNYLHRRKK